MGHVFNSDILSSEADRKTAREAFPDLFFALDDPVLRETFAPYDERANLSKGRSRRWGVFAVLLATVALLLAGAEMLYHDLGKTAVRIIAGIGGVAGIVSVLIGVFGIMFRDKKERWLSDRLATERLRQFHFQAFAMNPALVLKGARDDAAKEEYARRKLTAFNEMSSDLLDHLGHRLHEIVHAEDMADPYLIARDETPVAADDPHLDQYFRVYDELRFGVQIGYCDLILRKKGGFWQYAPVRQAAILGTIAMGMVFAILALHALVFAGAVFNIYWMKGPLVHVLAICAAIIALSASTFEKGFQPEREIERMRQYRAALKRLKRQFDEAASPEDKLAVMRETERLSYEEMAIFLQSNYEAKFVM